MTTISTKDKIVAVLEELYQNPEAKGARKHATTALLEIIDEARIDELNRLMSEIQHRGVQTGHDVRKRIAQLKKLFKQGRNE